MFECGSRRVNGGEGKGVTCARPNRIWWLNAFSVEVVIKKIKKKARYIPGVSFARYTMELWLYDFSFLTGVKKIAYEIRNNVYLLHTTATAVFEGPAVIITRREGFINFTLSFFRLHPSLSLTRPVPFPFCRSYILPATYRVVIVSSLSCRHRYYAWPVQGQGGFSRMAIFFNSGWRLYAIVRREYRNN